MIKETIKGYTVFNGLYQNKDKKMFSRTEKKEVIGNRLHKNFFKENFELLTLHLWDVQLDIKDYDNPQNNKNVTELIKQMRHTVKLLTNEKNEYGQYLREQTQQFLEWFDDYMIPTVEEKPTEKEQPKHENIFANNGFILFDYIMTEYVTEKRGRYEDISFYYRKMYKDKYIHQGIKAFKDWFLDIYGIDIGKIKSLYQVKKTYRERNYSNALNWFKQKI